MWSGPRGTLLTETQKAVSEDTHQRKTCNKSHWALVIQFKSEVNTLDDIFTCYTEPQARTPALAPFKTLHKQTPKELDKETKCNQSWTFI